jgi:uncharacterized repeat protein (TIGR03803 family)
MLSPRDYETRSLSAHLRTTKKTLAWLIGLVLTLALTQMLQAQTFTVIHNFGGPEGAFPFAGLTMDRAGNLYGTAFQGGTGGFGGVLKLSRSTVGWIATPIYSFQGGNNGGNDAGYPSARLVLGPDGNLYGTTAGGGESSCNYCGTVFKLTPPGPTCKPAPCPWGETVLYRFRGAPDGALPYSPVTFDQKLNIYGTTESGGSNCTYGCGTVYKLKLRNGVWKESILHNFTGNADGGYPTAGLIFDKTGKLYGTTPAGGSGGGTIFQLVNAGSTWTENVLYSFQNGSDGGQPYAGLIFDGAGNLYGTTAAGGAGNGGTAFELSPSYSGWTYQLLSSFDGSGFLGPYGDLLMDKAGNLYGTTLRGGSNNQGTVFKLTYSNGLWTKTVLHDFTGGDDGGAPYGNVVIAANGKIYGTAATGGQGYGIVWEIGP